MSDSIHEIPQEILLENEGLNDAKENISKDSNSVIDNNISTEFGQNNNPNSEHSQPDINTKETKIEENKKHPEIDDCGLPIDSSNENIQENLNEEEHKQQEDEQQLDFNPFTVTEKKEDFNPFNEQAEEKISDFNPFFDNSPISSEKTNEVKANDELGSAFDDLDDDDEKPEKKEEEKPQNQGDFDPFGEGNSKDFDPFGEGNSFNPFGADDSGFTMNFDDFPAEGQTASFTFDENENDASKEEENLYQKLLTLISNPCFEYTGKPLSDLFVHNDPTDNSEYAFDALIGEKWNTIYSDWNFLCFKTKNIVI